MSQLGSHYPNGGDEPITNSTHPTRMYPGHSKSSLAHSVMTTAPLICANDSANATRHRVCQDIWSNGDVPKTLDSHPQA